MNLLRLTGVKVLTVYYFPSVIEIFVSLGVPGLLCLTHVKKAKHIPSGHQNHIDDKYPKAIIRVLLLRLQYILRYKYQSHVISVFKALKIC